MRLGRTAADEKEHERAHHRGAHDRAIRGRWVSAYEHAGMLATREVECQSPAASMQRLLGVAGSDIFHHPSTAATVHAR